MAEKNYPPYVRRMLAKARQLLEEDPYAQMDVVALYFDVLALFPEYEKVSELIYETFCDRQLIYDNRKAIGRHIDEWDDRPWQQRRRLALSFRFMSRWEEKHPAYITGEISWPEDVADMAEEAHHQILQDYLLGQTRGGEVAWAIFQDAIQRTDRPEEMMLAVGFLYAEHAYFAESVDVLEALLKRNPRIEEARRLWVEVRWWRDNVQRIPWIPPDGAGQRYRRIMRQTDPNFMEEGTEEIALLAYMEPDPENLPADFETPVSVPELLRKTIDAVLGKVSAPEKPAGPVDWRYLDTLESGEIDVSYFPEWAQYLLLEIDDPEQEAWLKRYLLSYLAGLPDDEENDDAF